MCQFDVFSPRLYHLSKWEAENWGVGIIIFTGFSTSNWPQTFREKGSWHLRLTLLPNFHSSKWLIPLHRRGFEPQQDFTGFRRLMTQSVLLDGLFLSPRNSRANLIDEVCGLLRNNNGPNEVRSFFQPQTGLLGNWTIMDCFHDSLVRFMPSSRDPTTFLTRDHYLFCEIVKNESRFNSLLAHFKFHDLKTLYECVLVVCMPNKPPVWFDLKFRNSSSKVPKFKNTE